MKKTIRLIPLLLGLTATTVTSFCLSSTQKAAALTPSDWVGTWTCNNDGQAPFQVTFWPHYDLVIGKIDDDYWALQQRNFNSSNDPTTSRKDHVLTLSRSSNNTEWFLAMHTWDTRYASGFSRWNGSVFGLTCTRQ